MRVDSARVELERDEPLRDDPLRPASPRAAAPDRPLDDASARPRPLRFEAPRFDERASASCGIAGRGLGMLVVEWPPEGMGQVSQVSAG
ncbi:MAG: hypothetical protein ACO3S5_01945 [Ilumatobacteraceae bacterium]